MFLGLVCVFVTCVGVLPVFLFRELSLQLCALPCAGTESCSHFVRFMSTDEPPLIHRNMLVEHFCRNKHSSRVCSCLCYLAFVALVRKILNGDLVDSFHEPVRQTLLQISVKFNLHVIDDKMLFLCLSITIKEAWPL